LRGRGTLFEAWRATFGLRATGSEPLVKGYFIALHWFRSTIENEFRRGGEQCFPELPWEWSNLSLSEADAYYNSSSSSCNLRTLCDN